MKIRTEIHLGGEPTKLFLATRLEEKADHLALKLAAAVMFHSRKTLVDPSADHPALSGLTHRPDVCLLDDAGQISHWIECGTVSIRKLDKISRRLPHARILILKSTVAEAERLRSSLKEDVKRGERIEIWTWPENEFKNWLSYLEEKTEIFGEAGEKAFNLVVNNNPYAVDLLEF